MTHIYKYLPYPICFYLLPDRKGYEHDNKELYSKIKTTYGASLPREVFTPKIYDCLVWAVANIDRYNGHNFGS